MGSAGGVLSHLFIDSWTKGEGCYREVKQLPVELEPAALLPFPTMLTFMLSVC